MALSFGSVIFYLYLYQKLEDMNQITKIFSDLTNDELREAINEIKEDEALGLIREHGYVRRISKQVSELTNTPLSTQLFLTHSSLFREASYRFLEHVEKAKNLAWEAFMSRTDEREFEHIHRKKAKDVFETWWLNNKHIYLG